MAISTIGEIASACGLSVDTLRYYERAGLIPKLARDQAGRRVFGESDVAWVRYAVCLPGMGMGVADIAEYVSAAHREGGNTEQMALLEGLLARMRKQRAELDHFIAIAAAKLQAAGETK